MNKQVIAKEIVTVTEMSRMCRLSRARFYQLMGAGVFPTPSRRQGTNRPYYDRQQQELCLLVRRTNKGANGEPVMFYCCRLESGPGRASRPNRPKRDPSARTSPDQKLLTEIRHGLTQLGVAITTDDQGVREALIHAYPDGHRDIEPAELLRAVFEVMQGEDVRNGGE